MMISIHAPARGATVREIMTLTIWRNFNPRSREGSDGVNLSVSDKEFRISIHAPARGATQTFFELQLVLCISIHAPARGATKQNGWIIDGKGISIHAPARGATANITNFH